MLALLSFAQQIAVYGAALLLSVYERQKGLKQ
jgi:hypothetical protein